MQGKFVLLIILLIFGCSTSTSNEDQERATFFNGARDGESWNGDGVAFFQGDSMLCIRGIFGNSGQYRQIDIFIPGFTAGNYSIAATHAAMSMVIGGDAIGNVHESQGNTADFVSFEWNEEKTHISGQFGFSGTGWDTTTVALQGEFHIAAAESGTPWECGFITPSPSDEGCYFIP